MRSILLPVALSLAPKQPDDCQNGFRALADLVVELADTADVSVDFEAPARVTSRAELLEEFRARIGEARDELRQKHPEACIRELLGSMLLIVTPVEAGER